MDKYPFIKPLKNHLRFLKMGMQYNKILTYH